MIKKKQVRVLLDIVMLLVAVTLFNEHFINGAYHEIAGLVLLALIVVHIAINLKMAMALGKNIGKIPTKLKVGLVVDILLLLGFVGIGVSGVLISRVVFPGIAVGGGSFKMLHTFGAGMVVVLLGVHIGLHICRKAMPVVPAVLISVAVLGCGIYGLINSDEMRWLTAPLMMFSQQGEMQPPNGFGREQRPAMQDPSAMPDGSAPQGQPGGGQRPPMMRDGARNAPQGSAVQKLQTVVMFLGMILMLSMLTYWIAVPKKKKTAQVPEP